MSLRVGLGASKADLEVQGEIDFDFFEESECSSDPVKSHPRSPDHSAGESSATVPIQTPVRDELAPLASWPDPIPHEAKPPPDLNRPTITVSCDSATGVVQRTIEAVIPTPYNYKDSRYAPLDGCKPKKTFSPRLRSKVFREDHEPSDDSSISSMSEESDSEVSSQSADSFELEETDSMTDVSPLTSPAPQSPARVKKVGVKFTEEDERAKQQQAASSEGLDIEKLMCAMHSLELKQKSSGGSVGRALTRNAECRRNMSFPNSEVHKIEKENLLLLKKVKAQESRSKLPERRPAKVRASSGVNRQRQQRQIELENIAFLKRLESTKASKDLTRTKLLRDYEQRSSGCLSRLSSRSSYPSSTSQMSLRSSAQSSGRLSAGSTKSSSMLSFPANGTRDT